MQVIVIRVTYLILWLLRSVEVITLTRKDVQVELAEIIR